MYLFLFVHLFVIVIINIDFGVYSCNTLRLVSLQAWLSIAIKSSIRFMQEVILYCRDFCSTVPRSTSSQFMSSSELIYYFTRNCVQILTNLMGFAEIIIDVCTLLENIAYLILRNVLFCHSKCVSVLTGILFLTVIFFL